MALKPVLTAWEFSGTDIVSPTYTKTHFFPAEVSTSRYRRTRWNDDRIRDTEMYDVTAHRYANSYNEELPEQFEVLIVERHDGKTLTTKLTKASPVFEEQEIPDGEEDRDE